MRGRVGFDVLPAPNIDRDLRLFSAAESFGVENFSPYGSVEVFIVAIFPGAVRVDMDRLDVDRFQSDLQGCCNKLKAVAKPKE